MSSYSSNVANRLLSTCLLLWVCAASGSQLSRQDLPAAVDGADISAGVTAGSANLAAPPARDRPATVQQRPRWEVGLGGGYFSGYDYPASNDANKRLVVLPFFIYRTPRFRFGDGGVRAVAIEQPRVKLDLAVGGSLNARSEANSVRAGMEDLDFLLEIGPQLEISLLDKAVTSGGRVNVRFYADVRLALTTDLRRWDQRGLLLGLGMGANYRNVRNSGIDLLGSLGATFGSERLQDYYYEVDPQYVNDTRPAFDARSGYLQTRLFVGVGFKLRQDLRIVLGSFVDLYQGSRNQESPLHERQSSTGFGLGAIWTIKSSTTMVEVVDMGGDN